MTKKDEKYANDQLDAKILRALNDPHPLNAGEMKSTFGITDEQLTSSLDRLSQSGGADLPEPKGASKPNSGKYWLLPGEHDETFDSNNRLHWFGLIHETLREKISPSEVEDGMNALEWFIDSMRIPEAAVREGEQHADALLKRFGPEVYDAFFRTPESPELRQAWRDLPPGGRGTEYMFRLLEIAEGRPSSTITQLPKRERGRPRAKDAPDLAEKARALRKHGVSLEGIASALHIGKLRLNRVLKGA